MPPSGKSKTDYRYWIGTAIVVIGGLWAAFQFFYPFWESRSFHVCRGEENGKCGFEHDTFIGCDIIEEWAAKRCWSTPKIIGMGARKESMCGYTNAYVRCI